MKFVREQNVVGDRTPPPYPRTLKHLIAPWTVGCKNLWVGMAMVDPGSSSNPHSHEESEEVFFVLSGKGEIHVGDEHVEATPGTLVYVPPRTRHQIVNTGQEVFRTLNCASPPFELEIFQEQHLMKGD